jgi:hypothetical protein
VKASVLQLFLILLGKKEDAGLILVAVLTICFRCCENNNIEMEIPCGNFFEVTINSNKLYSFILEINKQIQSQ